jgi:hypothetical protein
VAEDIRALAGWVREGRWPYVECPTCRIGALIPDFLKGTASPRSLHDYDQNHDGSLINGHFHGVLKCTFSQCEERVTVAGDYDVDFDADDEGYTRPFDFFKLRYAAPPLDVLVPPVGTPEAVVQAIKSAGRIVWIDPGAAANRLRVAIEELLTDYGMRRTKIVNHKRVRLSTHAQIEEFKRYELLVGDTLEAVKWIGNAGSHEQDLTAKDVIDGAEILGYALRLLYDKSDEQMERRIRAVNKRKGLPKKATKK